MINLARVDRSTPIPGLEKWLIWTALKRAFQACEFFEGQEGKVANRSQAGGLKPSDQPGPSTSRSIDTDTVVLAHALKTHSTLGAITSRFLDLEK